jgi:hypothetical protein
LVNLLTYSLELHPDLPIFPGSDASPSAGRGPQGLFAGFSTEGLFSRADASAAGPVNFIRKISTPDTSSTNQNGNPDSASKNAADDLGRAEREASSDSVPPAWPKVGKGVLVGIELREEDFQDKDDYGAFSVTSYDNAGRKIIENGQPVRD